MRLFTVAMLGLVSVWGGVVQAGWQDGEFAVETNKTGGIMVTVNVDKIKDWSKVPGVKQCINVPLADGQTNQSMAFMSAMKDIDGDGKMDYFSRILEQPFSQVVRFDSKGKEVWRSEKIAPGAGDEAGMPLEDLDGDGRYELVLSQHAALYCLDAATGKINWIKELEKGGKPGPGSWDYPMVVGHFVDKKKFAIAVRTGSKLYCFGPDGSELWVAPLTGYSGGHCMIRGDLDGDGLDDIASSRGAWNGGASTEAFGLNGKLLWRDSTQRMHSDNMAIADIDGDGKVECIYDHSGCGGGGPLYVVDGKSGEQKFTIVYKPHNYGHCQGFAVADFRPDLPGLELAMTAKRGPLVMFDSKGKHMWTRKTQNTLGAKADWDGDGVQDFIVFAVGGPDLYPAWSVWNGKGEMLFGMAYLPSPAKRNHAYPAAPAVGYDGYSDQDGNGRADVLLAYGPWKTGAPQYLLRVEAPAK
jgi:outer membrane protein assembly factor BamB